MSNILYLLVSGLIMGSGPCLSLCGPVLISYSATAKNSLKKSLISYMVFSAGKILSYITLGLICVLGFHILKEKSISKFMDIAYFILGLFIILIGLTMILGKYNTGSSFCAWIHKGNIRNVGLLGVLIGLSPCLPLLGILNYIVMISNSAFDGIIYSFSFGLGTVFSPLLIFVMISGKTASYWDKKIRLKKIIQLVCGFILIFLGIKTIYPLIFS
ncbi:MAG: sulfite exporter TauE/SafE family protein [Candidatus Omnitrophica bacterium]|nr:sulfite exporter TauE/SafE family protein [Candidatus Omnitrophota bacterium]